MLTRPSRSLGSLLILTALGCSDDGTDVTGPGGVDFPTIIQSALDGDCIRGMAVPPTTVSGSIATTDCLTGQTPVGAGTEGYFEGWRVRVAVPTSVTFAATSEFDNFLDLFKITSVSNPALVMDNLLTFDDDSGEELNATVTAPLQPNTEYWIMISGVSGDDVGTYSLALTAGVN